MRAAPGRRVRSRARAAVFPALAILKPAVLATFAKRAPFLQAATPPAWVTLTVRLGEPHFTGPKLSLTPAAHKPPSTLPSVPARHSGRRFLAASLPQRYRYERTTNWRMDQREQQEIARSYARIAADASIR